MYANEFHSVGHDVPSSVEITGFAAAREAKDLLSCYAGLDLI